MTTSRRLILTTLAALAATPTAWGKALNACDLLTPQEICSIVAAPVSAGVALNSAATSSCKWQQSGVDPFKAITVVVSTKDAPAYEAGKGVRQPETVSGIGDDAYLTGKSLSYVVLSVKRGQSAFTLTIHGLKDFAATKNAEQALAKVAAGRM